MVTSDVGDGEAEAGNSRHVVAANRELNDPATAAGFPALLLCDFLELCIHGVLLACTPVVGPLAEDAGRSTAGGTDGPAEGDGGRGNEGRASLGRTVHAVRGRELLLLLLNQVHESLPKNGIQGEAGFEVLPAAAGGEEMLIFASVFVKLPDTGTAVNMVAGDVNVCRHGRVDDALEVLAADVA